MKATAVNTNKDVGLVRGGDGHGPSALRTTRHTIGQELERRRLEHRAQRLEAALRALHVRAADQGRRGAVPPGLSEAIGDFAAELAAVRARIDALAPEAVPAADVAGAAAA
jgi:hypothetical protein